MLQIGLKFFYKIGEASRIVGVEPSVLRFWETEFPFLRPQKNTGGQRIYTKKEINSAIQVKKLLYEEQYTISGVKKRFKQGFSKGEKNTSHDMLNHVRGKLNELLVILQKS